MINNVLHAAIIAAEKQKAALEILKASCGHRGVWADPTRYAWQDWTRDFALATLPLLLKNQDLMGPAISPQLIFQH